MSKAPGVECLSLQSCGTEIEHTGSVGKVVSVNREELLKILRDVKSLPEVRLRGGKANHRTIYEAGRGARLQPSGHFFVDYASYGVGSSEEVPREIIHALETDGTIVRAFPDQPEINAWVLNTSQEQTASG
jgi:hypothetical protein